MRDDGAVLMNFLSIPMTNPLLQKIGLALCAKRGVNYGGNPVSRRMAFQFAREFIINITLSTLKTALPTKQEYAIQEKRTIDKGKKKLMSYRF